MNANNFGLSDKLAFDVQGLSRLKAEAKTDSPEAKKAAAQQFEGIFINMLLKSMREASTLNGEEGGLFDSPQTKMYTEMMDKQLAQKLSTGKGLGLADIILKQWTHSQGANQVLSGSSKSDGQAAGVPALTMPTAAAPLAPAVKSASRIDRADVGVSEVKETASKPRSVVQQAKEFVGKLAPYAAEAARILGVPAHFLLGQAAFESGWGRGEIKGSDGSRSHNLFGIKAGANWKGPVVEVATTEYVNGVPLKKTEKFRAYASYAEGFGDYVKLLSKNPRYATVASNSHDAQSFARGLQDAKYATDPAYADKLTRVLNSRILRQSLLA